MHSFCYGKEYRLRELKSAIKRRALMEDRPLDYFNCLLTLMASRSEILFSGVFGLETLARLNSCWPLLVIAADHRVWTLSHQPSISAQDDQIAQRWFVLETRNNRQKQCEIGTNKLGMVGDGPLQSSRGNAAGVAPAQPAILKRFTHATPNN